MICDSVAALGQKIQGNMPDLVVSGCTQLPLIAVIVTKSLTAAASNSYQRLTRAEVSVDGPVFRMETRLVRARQPNSSGKGALIYVRNMQNLIATL